jgi:hypothetical protein
VRVCERESDRKRERERFQTILQKKKKRRADGLVQNFYVFMCISDL